MAVPYWKSKSLDEMSESEWESLCDGCGKCCLHKLEDDDGRVHLTVVACRLLDTTTARCSDYAHRSRWVPGCVQITKTNVRELSLPHSCAYRVLAEGRELASWHPLVAGDAASTVRARRSVVGWAVSETEVDEDDLEAYVLAYSDE